MASGLRQLMVHKLGCVPFRQAWQWQHEIRDEVLRGGGADHLILCEHPTVLTLGRLADSGYILASPQELKQRGIDVVSIDRGGEVTLHAPGQTVAYVIVDLKRWRRDLKAYLNQLEQSVIDFLSEFGIVASRSLGRTGVWVGERKIASVGIGVKHWVTCHGLAVNRDMDLRLFDLIRPCGLDVAMTSILQEIGRSISAKEAQDRFAAAFQACWGYSEILFEARDRPGELISSL